MTPEAKARQRIDERLMDAGWAVQDKQRIDMSAGLGIAVREYHTDSGPVDYALFVDRKPVGVIEAKRDEEGVRITAHETQTRRYANSQFRFCINQTPIRFGYEATGIMTRFTDYRDEKPRSRKVFSFFRPETLQELLRDTDTLRNRLRRFPQFDLAGFRDCQTRAILGLERSFSQNHPRALIQMATGAGKTYTAITSSYRLLKHARAKRILFLVDTRNLAKQAEQEYRGYKPNDDTRLFPELYNVYRLNSPYIPPDAQVCFSTIQRMYSILKGTELDERDELDSPYERWRGNHDREVVYNEKYPPEYFDFIIIDECHRSIYTVWRQVLEYFDAFLIGLTATPDARTFGFFQQNVVSEYSYEMSVIDNVNVGYDVYRIETDVTKNGATILKQYIEKRDRLTRQRRWEQMDEDETYAGSQLDRAVVNPSQINAVIQTFRDRLYSDIFPGRREVPKTIIFAKTDSHAEDIIEAVRRIFGEGNDFCRKVTCKADDADAVLASFRNEYNPRIAVTVDMIATGTNVKPVECLLFMRDVRSKNYFEQMKGRGARTLSGEMLQHATPSAVGNKSRFVIVDAVGVTESVKTDSRPFERKPSIPMADLMAAVASGSTEEDVFVSLAGRLTRLDKQLSPAEQKAYENASGEPLRQTVQNLLGAFDPDNIERKAREDNALPPDAPIDESQYSDAREALVRKAARPFDSPDLREAVEEMRRSHDQIIDDINQDTVIDAGWSAKKRKDAEKAIQTFQQFLADNRDRLDALSILYSHAWRERPLTFAMVKAVHEALHRAPYSLTAERLWDAYRLVRPDKVKASNPEKTLTNIVSILRFEMGVDGELRPFRELVDWNFQRWTFGKNAGNVHFTEEQMEWLRMVKDFIAASMAVTPDDLDDPPMDRYGGRGRFYKLFGDRYTSLLDEMNSELAA